MLKDTLLRGLKATGEPKKYSDGGGLYLFVSRTGGRLWRMDYRFEGKRKTLSFGAYPAVGLKDARQKREEAKEQLAKGIDPGAHKQAVKASVKAETENTFEIIAREWFEKKKPAWKQSHSSKVISRLEKNIFPFFGNKGITSVDAPEILEALRHVEARDAVDCAHRCLQYCNSVYRYAIATKRAARNPAADLRGALSSVKRKHYASIHDPRAISILLRDIDEYSGNLVTRFALRLAPYVFIRSGELHRAEWKDFDFKEREWRVHTKMQAPHIVPLCSSAIAILKELHRFTGNGKYLFPSPVGKSRPITSATLLKALRRMGYDKETMTVHGFKSMASTLLNKEGFNRDWIEVQLDHRERNDVRASYNFYDFLRERRSMMDWWGNYLDELKTCNHG